MIARLFGWSSEDIPRRPAVGMGLAEWAQRRGLVRPYRTLARELLFSFIDKLAEALTRPLFAAFRIDDRGQVHVHDNLVAVFIGVAGALLVLAFEMVAVGAYNTGFAQGMQAGAAVRWGR